MLAWLQGSEPAVERVESLLCAARAPLMSWINVCEVYYRVERDHDREQAEQIIARLRSRLSLELPSVARCLAAARIKAEQPIALADCFCAATALAHRLPLLTGDPELLRAAPHLRLDAHDLRPSPSG